MHMLWAAFPNPGDAGVAGAHDACRMQQPLWSVQHIFWLEKVPGRKHGTRQAVQDRHMPPSCALSAGRQDR